MRDSPRIRSLSNIVSFIVFTSIRLAVNPTFFKPTIRQLLRLCAQITPPGQSREEKEFLFHI